MILDAHQHFLFPSRTEYPWMVGDALEPLRRDFTPEDLYSELERCGVQHTVLVQTRSSLEETREFLRIARDTPFVAGVVGWVDLTAPDVGEVLDALLGTPEGRWLVGVRHQVHDEPDAAWLTREDVARGLAALEGRGLTYDLLVRPRELPAALEVVRAHPGLTFVLDHAAKPDLRSGSGALEGWRAALEPLSVLENVCVKLSGLVTEADWAGWTPAQVLRPMLFCMETFGPERCLYGSDWPVCLLAASYGQTLELVERLLEGYGQQARGAVLGGNAARAYRLALRS